MVNSVVSGNSQVQIVAALVDDVLVAAAFNQIHFSPLQRTQVLFLACTSCTGMHILILHISQTTVILSLALGICCCLNHQLDAFVFPSLREVHLFKKPVFHI